MDCSVRNFTEIRATEERVVADVQQEQEEKDSANGRSVQPDREAICFYLRGC